MRGTLKIAWFALIFASIALIPAAVRAEHLKEMFLPQSGHIEMKASISVKLTNADVRTLEDVLALREKLNDRPFDEASVTSWKFLERAGLKKVERELPPPMRNVPADQMILSSEWQDVVIDFDGSRQGFSVDDPGDLPYRSEVTVGPGSCVELEQLNGRWTYRHFNYVRTHSWRHFNCERLLSREAFLFRNKYSVRPIGNFELFTTMFEYRGRDELLLVDREQDAVLVRASRWKHNDLIHSFTLHMQMQSQESPQPHQVPAVTLHFYGGRGVGADRTWHCNVYWLEKADFAVTFPPERFVLNVPAKERYHAEGEKYPRWVNAPILDITHKTLKMVTEELNKQHK
ncbi:hypothetical protein [Blastopirellula marina]|uniref:Uncharacterized protein n=1 Tax=Blastopirellula marina DSM 3645 TaxID=314230 RepID=A3ZUE8_9BACT|nr:hypothetical protein [Blastopirellula marina]EAQ79858.1 hypothetical protein DSM3645_21999 [Blastopirellula marina DSM 3645]